MFVYKSALMIHEHMVKVLVAVLVVFLVVVLRFFKVMVCEILHGQVYLSCRLSVHLKHCQTHDTILQQIRLCLRLF